MKADTLVQVVQVPPEERVCGWYDDHDPVTMEPRGKNCGEPATHVIEWTWIIRDASYGFRRWSFACPAHIGPPGIDPSDTHGWEYTTTELEFT